MAFWMACSIILCYNFCMEYIIVPDHVYEYTFANVVMPRATIGDFSRLSLSDFVNLDKPLNNIHYHTIYYDPILGKFPTTVTWVDDKEVTVQVIHESKYRKLCDSGVMVT